MGSRLFRLSSATFCLSCFRCQCVSRTKRVVEHIITPLMRWLAGGGFVCSKAAVAGGGALGDRALPTVGLPGPVRIRRLPPWDGGREVIIIGKPRVALRATLGWYLKPRWGFSGPVDVVSRGRFRLSEGVGCRWRRARRARPTYRRFARPGLDSLPSPMGWGKGGHN